MEIPIKDRLCNSDRILICGMGGGFDIYSGIPLYFSLRGMGKQVFLANYSFSFLPASKGKRITPTGWIIHPDCNEIGYFPEKYLAEWLASKGQDAEVIGLEKSGVIPLHQTLEEIIRLHKIDALILVDGGTDSLMRGDEYGLGTPTEDITSIAASHDLDVKEKILMCVGFGIDHFHGVNHSQFLENVSDLIAENGFHGVNTVTQQDEEGKLFLDLVKYANERGKGHQSIVANSIASSIEGKFGNYHATTRTRGSQLYINPLMSFHWYFSLEAVATKVHYLSQIAYTQSEMEVKRAIQAYRNMVHTKPWDEMPY